MRYVWMVFAALVLAMVVVLPRLNSRPTAPVPYDSDGTRPRALQAKLIRAAPRSTAFAALRAQPPAPDAHADSVVAFGLAQRGTPYLYAGTSPVTGFDCSGFIMFTFARFGVAVPHSTALLIDVGRPVARAEAQPGDIVVFTGTAATSTSPGHAGIVISGRGEVPLRFVHSSSARRESGVKVSQVDGTDYERRFMQVRRVLGPGSGMASAKRLAVPIAGPAAATRTAAAVASLPTQKVEIERSEVAATAPPVVLQPIKLAAIPKKPAAESRSQAAKKPMAKKPSVKKAVAGKPVAKKKTLPQKPATSSKSRKATIKK